MAKLRVLSGATKLAVALLVAACLGSISQVSIADSGPIQMPGTSHWYQSISASLTWDEAMARAQSMTYNGMVGHLLTITSTAEDSWISREFPSGVFWMGARDVGQSVYGVRTWQWAVGPDSGTTFTACTQAWWADNCSPVDGAYTNWHSVLWQQPDGRGSDTAGVFSVQDNSGWWYDGIPSDRTNATGYIIEFESSQGTTPVRVGDSQTFRSSTVFTAAGDGLYRVDLLGAGGGGGNQYDGYVAGGGGGGGAFASGVILLRAGQTLSLTVGTAGAGGIPYKWSNGAAGGDSSATLDGVTLIVAGGGAGGSGASSSAGGSGGLPSFGVSDVLSQAVGFAGGAGSAARLNWPIYHNGGEGGSAANSSGAGFDGTSTLCSWVSSAPDGRMPSGAGGRGYTGGYEGSVSNCVGVSAAVGVGNVRGGQGACGTAGQNFGGGGGGGHDTCPTSTMMGAPGLAIVTTLAVRPSVPTIKTAVASDGAALVSWDPAPQDVGSMPTYTVTASPSGKTCTSTDTLCTVAGLTNRTIYTFTVTASNEVGTSPSSAPSAAVMPLAPGFQMWPTDQVMAIGTSTTLNLAQAAAGPSIAVTGAVKATLGADSSGAASTPYVASKSGLMKFSAAYSVRVGKKTTKYSTTAQIWVPSVVGPGKVKLGKSGTFTLSYCPPSAPVVVTLSDGRSMNLTADAAGKTSSTLAFGTRGAVTYTVAVSGVQVFSGGLTVS